MRTLNSLSDMELVRSFNQGCDKAFDTLFLRYREDVCNVIQHYLKNNVEAEELAHDVFLKVYASLKRGKYNEQGKFLPWCLRIARNLCMDFLRKAAQLPPVRSIVHNDVFGTTAYYNTVSQLENRQQEQQVNTLINRLPGNQKRVVRYHYFDELSFKEISALMNTSVSTSRARMRYGLIHLRKQVNNTPAA